jgi:hypothetical protein
MQLQETGYIIRQYEVKDRFGGMLVDVTLRNGRIHTVTLHAGKRIELTPYDIRVVLEIIKRHPLPELPEEVG